MPTTFPIYSFELMGSGGATRTAHPLYGEGLEKQFRKESGEQFFRTSLNGELTFIGSDYDWLMQQNFDTEIEVTITMSNDAGATWNSYFKGTFVRTDCVINAADKTLRVALTPQDKYTKLLERINDEFDLVKLLPEILRVNIDRRPLLQVYMPGSDVIGCYMGGQWWEQECAVVTEDEVVQIYDPYETIFAKKLTGYYHFGVSHRVSRFTLSGTGLSPDISGIYSDSAIQPEDLTFQVPLQNGTYTLYFYNRAVEPIGGYEAILQVHETADPNNVLWRRTLPQRIERTDVSELQALGVVTLVPVTGGVASGDLDVAMDVVAIYSRLLTNAATYNIYDTYPLPNDDITSSKGYKRVLGYRDPNIFTFSTLRSATPTEWGLTPDDNYYARPPAVVGVAYPMCRKLWDSWSLWFLPPLVPLDAYGVESMVLNDAYPLDSVIKKLLAQIDNTITYAGDSNHSQFFYASPVVYFPYKLAITPKSNLLALGYDTPAKQAPITLRQVFDMLRDCFRCYWHLDANGALHIEHILYYRNGEDYNAGGQTVEYDLRALYNPKNDKALAFGQQEYKYDKSELPSRYEFGWMDSGTPYFNGFPFVINSPFVNKDKIEQVIVQNFTSDADYMMINPGACSKDGFALLSLTDEGGGGGQPQYVTILNATYLTFVTPTIIPLDVAVTEQKDGQIRYEATGAGTFTMDLLNSANGVLDTINLRGNIGLRIEDFVIPAGTTKIRLTASISTNISIYYIRAYEQQPPAGQGWWLPYYEFLMSGEQIKLLNGPLSFEYLQRYYAYDMPAPTYTIEGVTKNAYGTKRIKTSEAQFPALSDPDPMRLLGTFVGVGQIEELSVNLSSRNCKAKIVYDAQ